MYANHSTFQATNTIYFFPFPPPPHPPHLRRIAAEFEGIKFAYEMAKNVDESSKTKPNVG